MNKQSVLKLVSSGLLAWFCASGWAAQSNAVRPLEQWEVDAIAGEAPEPTPKEMAREFWQLDNQVIIEPAGDSTPIEIVVDKDAQIMEVTIGGEHFATYYVSTARRGFHTPVGEFQIQRMAESWFSSKYDNSPMPNSLFFDGGIAVHGHYGKNFPRFASHGCVRLHPDDAIELWGQVLLHGRKNVRITVYGGDAPGSADQGSGAAPAPAKKKKSIFDIFSHPVESNGLY